MKRGLLRWFFLGVQFVMLAVSIPKVAMLFHAYNTEQLGSLIGGIDIQSWCVGLAIDLTATVTTWAALQKYEATGKRLSLLAPGFIIAVCSSLSVVANYEAAATLHPAQYTDVSLFTQPALYINPLLISAPPVIVLLLILIVPSVLAQPRIKTAHEIAAETDQEEALIVAGARLREVRARANAQVRSARVGGLADTLGVVRQRTGLAKGAQPAGDEPRGLDGANRAPEVRDTAHYTRTIWNALPLKDRVLKSEIISAQELSEALAISATRARELMKGVRSAGDEQRAVKGRTGVLYTALIESLYERRTPEGAAQARKLETALGVRKRARPLTVVTDDATTDESTEESAS
jgi:hypothetical protein